MGANREEVWASMTTRVEDKIAYSTPACGHCTLSYPGYHTPVFIHPRALTPNAEPPKGVVDEKAGALAAAKPGVEAAPKAGAGAAPNAGWVCSAGRYVRRLKCPSNMASTSWEKTMLL